MQRQEKDVYNLMPPLISKKQYIIPLYNISSSRIQAKAIDISKYFKIEKKYQANSFVETPLACLVVNNNLQTVILNYSLCNQECISSDYQL